jgi:putative peptidoglycan lipid II flippase
VSISGSNLVHFSESWKKGDKARAIDFLKESYILTFLVLIPAMALLMAMSSESVNLIFEHGRFYRADTISTSLALKFYLVGLPFYGLYKVFGPTFYALEKPRIPVTISICSLAVNILFCLVMVKHFGFAILALGTSLAMFLNTFGQAFFLRKELGLGGSFFLDKRLLKTILAGLICYFTTRFFCHTFYDFNGRILIRAFSFVGIGTIGALVFVLVLASLGELQSLKRLLKKKS